jgi:flagellar biosynthesis protein FliR
LALTYLEFILNLNVFFLVFVRVTGLFVVAPIFGRKNMPSYYKIGFSFFIALIMMNTISVTGLENVTTIWEYGPLVLKEFLVGVTLGYVGYIVFTGIYIAGQIIDMKIGFGVVNVVDPQSNIQVPITANFYTTITMLIFLVSRGHYLLIRALSESYSMVSIGEASFSSLLMEDILRLFGSVFSIGFKIAIPIVAAVFVADIGLGIIAKTVPQLNIFVVGMPLKIAMGFAIIFITIPSFMGIVNLLTRGLDSEMFSFLQSLKGQ